MLPSILTFKDYNFDKHNMNIFGLKWQMGMQAARFDLTDGDGMKSPERQAEMSAFDMLSKEWLKHDEH